METVNKRGLNDTQMATEYRLSMSGGRGEFCDET